MMHRKHIGAARDLAACMWLLREGYEVFRNVSAHGVVDIVGLKDGQLHLFDVKTTKLQNGAKAERKLTIEQVDHGVKCILALPDGDCEIVERPRAAGRVIPRKCPQCKTEFIPSRSSIVFCDADCKRIWRGKVELLQMENS